MPPRIERLRLPALTEATADEVRSGDTREGEVFTDVDFSRADLEHTSFVSCLLDRTGFDEAELRGLHLVESRLSQVDAASFAAPRSTWRNVHLTSSRLGSVELYEGSWRSVVIEDSKVGYVNARSSTWQDVVLRNCVITELDLTYATISRLAIEGCQIGTLDLSSARLVDVDLRGAELQVVNGLDGLAGSWISPDQLTQIAPLLAEHLRIKVG